MIRRASTNVRGGHYDFETIQTGGGYEKFLLFDIFSLLLYRSALKILLIQLLFINNQIVTLMKTNVSIPKLSALLLPLVFTFSCKNSLEKVDPINKEKISNLSVVLISDSSHAGYIILLKPSEREQILLQGRSQNYETQQTVMRSYASNILQRNGIKNDKVKSVYSFVGGFHADLSYEEVNKIKNDASVDKIDVNHVFTVDLPKPTSVSDMGILAEQTPPGVTRVRGGVNNALAIPIWVLDTGCDLDHPELNVSRARAKSFVSGTTTANDDHGHGTHVSGIIGARKNGNGVVGVAPNALIVPVKIANSSGVTSDALIISGFDYAGANAAPGDVINASLGYPQRISKPTVDSAVMRVARRFINIVLAAGNSRDDVQYYPMVKLVHSYIDVVSAIDASDHFAVNYPNSSNGSNFGPSITFAEPGVSIYSTWKDGGYATLSGTSMAAPHKSALFIVPADLCNCPCEPFPRPPFCIWYPFDTYAIGDPDGHPDVIGVHKYVEYHPVKK